MKTQNRLELKFKDFISEDSHPYFLYIHDAQGTFTYLSPSLTLLLGYTPQEFQTNYMTSLTPNPINKHVILNTEKTLLTGEQQEAYNVEVYDKQLNRRLLHVFETPIIGEAGIDGIEGIAKVLN